MTKPGVAYDNLIKGSSKSDIARNIATERKSGKPEKQAIAIAFSKAREARKDK